MISFYYIANKAHKTEAENFGVRTLSYRGKGLGRGKPIEDAAMRLQELGLRTP